MGEWRRTGFCVSTDKARLQLDRVHRFLSTEAYWSINVPREIVARAAESSLCFGLFDETGLPSAQIGYARVVTDNATFAWLCDVYVETAFRRRGLSKWLMECVMSELLPLNLRRICLTTKDAHTLYEKFGIHRTKTPESWMELKDNDLYSKLKRLAGRP